MLGNKLKTQNLRGLTLIEVLLSVVIISLMMGAVVIIYTGALRNWNWMDPKLLLQQEATIAMNKIERQLKKAGSIYHASDKSVTFSPLPLVTPKVDSYTVSLWRFDEGIGTTAEDETDSNDGTLGIGVGQRPAWTASGENGYALDFDGKNDLVDCGSGNTLDIADKLTVEAWIQPDSGSADGAIIYKDNAYRLYLNSDDKLVGSIYYSSAWHGIASTSRITRNGSTWTNVAFTYDKDEGTGEELRLYINGIIDATANHTSNISTSGNNLYIGRDHTKERYPFNGVIDEVRVSNDIRRTKISWEGDAEDKIVLEVSGISHQLNDECNTDTFVMNYYDENYNKVTDTTTQENRNSIRIVKVLLGLEKDSQEFSLENVTTLRKELPGEAETGLVGYWKMDEDSWNGTTGEVIDSSGNNNHGTAKNGANTIASGKVGRCGNFDGSDDYVSAPNIYWPANTDFAIEYWMKFSSYSPYQNILSTTTSGHGNSGWWTEFGSARGFTMYSNRNLVLSDNIITLTGLSTDTWYHVVITRSGMGANNTKGYINNTLFGQSSSNIAIGDATNNLLFGKYAKTASTSRLNGTIDEVKIYNRALSEEEIEAHYLGLVALYHMDEDSWDGTADKVIDSSGKGNHGSAHGGASIVLNGGPTTPDGYDCGNCGSFDGSDDYINVTSSDFYYNDAITVEAWIKLDKVTGVQGISTSGEEAGQPHWLFQVKDNKLRLYVKNAYYTSNTVLSTGVWYFVAFSGTQSGGGKFYLNGDNDGNIPAWSTGSSGAHCSIGKSGGRNYFSGLIDEVAIYNRVLSEEEIQAHYTEGPPEGSPEGPIDIYRTSGTYISSVKDAEKSVSWKKISWEEDANYGEELGPESRMVGLWHMNEESGIIVDYSGEENNGTSHGGVTYKVDGKFNTALSFDGSDDYIDVTSSDFYYNDAITVEAWIKLDKVTGVQGISTSGEEAGQPHWLFQVKDNKLRLYVKNAYYTSNTVLSTGVWYFVAFSGTQSGGGKFYLNGDNDGNIPAWSTGSSGAHCSIGKSGGRNYFSGLIDEVAIYNRALSASEVLEHYKRGACNLKFQVRSGSADPPTGDFVGPDGTTDTYFTDASGEDMGINVSDNQYFQYKAYFSTENKRYTPELHSVTITYGSDEGGGVSGAYIYQWEEVFE